MLYQLSHVRKDSTAPVRRRRASPDCTRPPTKTSNAKAHQAIRRPRCHDDRVSLDDRPDPRAPDPRRPTAAEWLAAPTPGRQPSTWCVLGVPRFTGSTAALGAHATPAAVRRVAGRPDHVGAVARASTWRGCWSLDRGDVADPDGDEGEWRVRMAAATAATTAKVVLGLGGDASVTPPLVDGGLRRLDRDDRRGAGRARSTTCGRAGPAPAPPAGCSSSACRRSGIVQVGLADWAESPSYDGEAATLGIRTFPARHGRRARHGGGHGRRARPRRRRRRQGLRRTSTSGSPTRPPLPAAVARCRAGCSADAVRDVAYAAGRRPAGRGGHPRRGRPEPGPGRSHRTAGRAVPARGRRRPGRRNGQPTR